VPAIIQFTRHRNPPHSYLCEVFIGSLSVLCRKQNSNLDTHIKTNENLKTILSKYSGGLPDSCSEWLGVLLWFVLNVVVVFHVDWSSSENKKKTGTTNTNPMKNTLYFRKNQSQTKTTILSNYAGGLPDSCSGLVCCVC
jgi:hypothetical protein